MPVLYRQQSAPRVMPAASRGSCLLLRKRVLTSLAVSKPDSVHL